MLRKIYMAFFLLSFCTFAATAQTLTVDEIVSKHLKAIGGEEKIKAIKSIKSVGKVSLQGIEAPLTIRVKRPGLVHLEVAIQGQSVIQAYDGETAWTVNPFAGLSEAQKMSAEEAKPVKEQADIDGFLLDYKTKGTQVELIGKEDLEGSPAYKLKITTKEGDVIYQYLDASNFLLLKQTNKQAIQGSNIDIDSYFSDYKPVNGIMMSHASQSKVQGQTVFQYTIEKIEMDVAIEDNFFKMPVKGGSKEPVKE